MTGIVCAARAAFLPVTLAVLTLLSAAGCGGGKDVRPVPPPPAAHPQGPMVAVAPMENRSNDLSASDIIRDAFAAGVADGGFAVMPLAESDRILRESLGISYGGQLPTTTPREVCAALGVDGVFYGEVEEWIKTTAGLYNSVSVAASFQLYRKDGSLAWQGKDRQLRQDVPQWGGNLGAEIIARGLGNLLLNPMTPYGVRVGRNIARKVPWGVLDHVSK